MLGNRKKTRGRAPAFLAALLAMLALGAVAAGAAQARPVWSIDGQSFTGEETAAWRAGGIEFQQVGGDTLKCSLARGTDTISGGDEGEVNPSLGLFMKCHLQEAECKADAFPGDLHTQLIQVDGVLYEKYTVVENENNTWLANECFSGGEVSGSFAAEIGPEAVESTSDFTAAAEEATGTQLMIGGEEVSVRGEARENLSGVNEGSTFGATTTSGTLGWYIEGEALKGEEEFELSGDEGSSLDLEWPKQAKVECADVTMSGGLSSPAGGEGTLTAGECVLLGAKEQCTIQPIEMKVEIGLTNGADGKAIETFAPTENVIIEPEGAYCPWWGGGILASGESFGAEMAEYEATEMPLNGSPELAYSGAAGEGFLFVWLEGSFTQQLPEYEGVFGAW